MKFVSQMNIALLCYLFNMAIANKLYFFQIYIFREMFNLTFNRRLFYLHRMKPAFLHQKQPLIISV